MKKSLKVLITILVALYGKGVYAGSHHVGLPERIDWKSQRDESIERQQFDYSCGASSVATIIKHFYGVDTSESAILQLIPDLDGDLAASFLELSRSVEHLGFQSKGIEIDFEKLLRIKIPAIAHVRYEGRDHFTVVRGINKQSDLVWLADPSWGNRVLSRYQFLKLWAFTGYGRGRLLLILPKNVEVNVERDFFGEPQDWLSFAKNEWLRRRATLVR